MPQCRREPGERWFPGQGRIRYGTVEMVGGAGQELLSRLGASMTDYGAPSARGQPLFRLLTPEDAVLTEESTPTWGEMQL